MFEFSPADLQALWLTFKLASVVTILLLILCTPLAWWLARSRSWLKAPVSALVAMPLVLPPTVLGFYLLVAMGPNGPIGKFTEALGIGLLPFSFAGLVVGSLLYSLPFVVQPLQNSMQAIGDDQLEAAAALRAGPWERFFCLVLPLSRPGFVSAALLGFAHTLGEFGVVLMIGGNIPGETRVASVQIYTQVEALQYLGAHRLSLTLLILSFAMLLVLYGLNRQKPGLDFGVRS